MGEIIRPGKFSLHKDEARLKDRAFLFACEDEDDVGKRLCFVPIGGRTPPIRSEQHIHAHVKAHMLTHRISGLRFVDVLPKRTHVPTDCVRTPTPVVIKGYVCVAYEGPTYDSALSYWRRSAAAYNILPNDFAVCTTHIDVSISDNSGGGVVRAYVITAR